MPQVDGFLNFCKPPGWTSHDVVQLVRRRLHQRRVGHAGTLDPAASGVLPICLGRATRLADRVAEGSKLYAADLVLGAATDTCDAEGRVVATAPVDQLTLADVLRALAGLVGPLEQRPPAYSALKIRGEPAYARARRGEAVEVAPRRVTIYGLAVLGWQPPWVSIVLRCSKGTYVRAVARDVGDALGCGAYLDALVRLRVGAFALADAVTVEEFEAAIAQDRWRELVLPPDRALLTLPAALLGQDKVQHFAHGRAWSGAAPDGVTEARAYAVDGRFLGLVRAQNAGSRWQPALSFVYDAGVTANG